MPKKVVIVGGVAGGASCAARLRRLSEQVQITMFEKGEYISFANCGLPYYIGGVIEDRSKLLVQTVDKMSKRFNLDIRNYSEVIKIDRQNKQVQVKNWKTNEVYYEKYDKLVLAPGADPIKPPIPGINAENIYTLRNIPDTDRIKKYIDENKPKKAVVIGGGFIGLEMIEMMALRGIQTTLVEMADHVMGPLDYEMASLVHQHLKLQGVEVFLQDGVTEFEEQQDKSIKMKLQSGKIIETDFIVLSIGVKPEIKLAKEAGIKCNKGIVTNLRMETSDSDIYALGDAAEVQNIVSKQRALIPLAGPANKQGRIVADQITGRKVSKFKGSQGTGIVKIFDIHAATTGLNERQLRQLDREYMESITHSSSHAGYYPGGFVTAIKILFCPYSGQLFGAQVVGAQMVDKRIDVLATAVRQKMTVYDLEELELAYAPPFSSAKDPVNYAGFVGANMLKGDVKMIQWNEIQSAVQNEGAILIDVRTPEEYEQGTIPGSINIELDTIRDNLDKFPKDKKLIIFCQAGLRAYIASRILYGNGYKEVYDLAGGFKTWHYAFLKQSNEGIFSRDKITSQGMVVQEVVDKALNSNYVYWDKDFENFSPIKAKQKLESHPLYDANIQKQSQQN
ncbi:Rhodanese-like domain [Pseudocohnilembus persalinus]|uniref:Rhodanese-like domain n=1 Tax=Pseudocohnilembus persalinus TaxID=266149 RepID=A0A0V0QRI7_PSEPJ|nr:Rhodanese-like domain [Pseudocohnilembus persalinus]|eukprot:KRX04911.1 Rhodanese-like domain [Pseudocohnilembus persalinus]